jgi:hypothetical protein
MILLFLLPGTFLHELSHYIVGLVLGAKPVNFSLIPNKKQGSAGHVGFQNINFFNAVPVALAPVFGGGLALFWMYHNFWLNISDFSLVYQALGVYLSFAFFKTMLPSSTDIGIAFSYPLGLVLWGGCLYLSYPFLIPYIQNLV